MGAAPGVDFSDYLKLINNCDRESPLLSETKLGEYLNQIKLNQVDLSELLYSSQALDLEQLIRTDSGIARDYRGLAELMGFGQIETETRFKRSSSPTKSLIYSYIEKNRSLQTNGKHVTVKDLLKLIEKLERFDVIDDMLPVFIRLASHSTSRTIDNHLRLEVDKRPTSGQVDLIEHQQQNNLVKDIIRLTVDDTTLYDAFVCYAHEDTQLAQDLILFLREKNLRIATADDLLPGHFEQDALVQLIDTRCRKVIIILTPNFMRSKECEFQTKFASEVAIKARDPKILPVLYEPCDESALPYMIRVISKIDMTDKRAQPWQLKKLLSSLGFFQLPNSLTSSARPYQESHSLIDRTTDGEQQLNSLNHFSSTVPDVTLSGASRSESPIVELAPSTVFGSNNNSALSISTESSTQPTSGGSTIYSQGRISPSRANRPVWLQNWNWKNVKKVFGSNSLSSASADGSSILPSTSSQALLLSNASERSYDEPSTNGTTTGNK